MSCGCNKINKKVCSCVVPCGCSDMPLRLCAPCTPTLCGNGDPCAETFSTACVVYTGDTIVDVGIVTGQRLDSIIQLFALLATNPGCIYPTAPCQSVLGLQSTVLSATSIGVKWFPVVNAISYQVSYRATTSLTWLVNPVVPASPNPIDSIGPLLPNTSYYIKVNTICGTFSCTSLTILVTTLAT